MVNPWHSLIFGFDPGTKFGWSVFLDGELTASGTFVTLRDGEVKGNRYLNLLKFLTELFKTYVTNPNDTLVGYEDIAVHIFKSKDSLRVYSGIMACIEMTCAKFGVGEIRGVNPISLKKWATGDDKATKQKMIIEATYRFQIKSQSDDHADACLIGAYFREHPCPTMELTVQTRFENKRKKAEKKAKKAARQSATLKSSPSSLITLPPTLLPKRKRTKQPRPPLAGE
jgi:hypothetical protein